MTLPRYTTQTYEVQDINYPSVLRWSYSINHFNFFTPHVENKIDFNNLLLCIFFAYIYVCGFIYNMLATRVCVEHRSVWRVTICRSYSIPNRYVYTGKDNNILCTASSSFIIVCFRMRAYWMNIIFLVGYAEACPCVCIYIAQLLPNRMHHTLYA